MRPIHIAALDKARPAVVLTREGVRPYRRLVTIAPITSTIRGLAVEVPVGVGNGVELESVVNCDDIQTIPVSRLGRRIGFLHDDQEAALAAAVVAAFDLES